MSVLKKYFSGLSTNTFLLALASLFADISSEMLYPVLPIFLTQGLGASATVVGLVDGVGQAAQNVVQGFSGWLADRLRRRKALALFGYVLGAMAKPLIGISTAWQGALAARALDRAGSGTRAAPRDAMVAASTDEAHRGRAFGLEGFGDNLGAFLGPLCAVALLSLLHVGLRTIFLLAVVPGVLAALMVALVRDTPTLQPSKAKLDLGVGRFSADYWKYLLASTIFGLGNSSNAFLILRTKALGATLTTTILIYSLFNLVAALVSFPAGHLSDTLGRKHVLLLAFGVDFVVYGGMGLTSNVIAMAVLFVLYGLYQGAWRSVGKALASDFVPQERRASAIGWYMATTGLAQLVASVIGGQLWTRIGPQATFLFGAATALAGGVALAGFVKSGRAPSPT